MHLKNLYGVKMKIIYLMAVSLVVLSSCGKECKVVSVDSTGSPSHNHTSTTIFDGAKTYSAALTAASAGSAHDHDITLTDEQATKMLSQHIDVTGSSTNSHTHTAGIECN
jgi:hypothetical protein